MRLLLALAAAVAAFAAGSELVPSGGAEGGPRTARVLRVVDGDTLRVRLDGRSQPVRVIGIDTPELRPRRGGPPECYARPATAALERRVGRGSVRLVPDAERRDRYDRLLAYVERGDLDVGEWLLRNGFARPLVVEPNVARRDRYARAARDARRAGRGLWAACRG